MAKNQELLSYSDLRFKMFKPKNDSNDWFMMHSSGCTLPQTTTQESLEQGIKYRSLIRTTKKKQLNFQSYPMNDFRFDLMEFESEKNIESISTYKRDYVIPYPPICKPKDPDFNKRSPDNMFNKRPVNDFDMNPYSSHKFMDDHLTEISPVRQKINFFRQLK